MIFEDEPEDSFDASDPVDEKLANLARRLEAVNRDPGTLRNQLRLRDTRQDFGDLVATVDVVRLVVEVSHWLERLERGGRWVRHS